MDKREAKFLKNRPVAHWSDCSVNNEPAYPSQPCDCGAVKAQRRYVTYLYHHARIWGVHWKNVLWSKLGL